MNADEVRPPEIEPDAVNPPTSRTFWAHLRHPYAVGFHLMLGALTAFALGVTVSGLSTVLIYIAFAFFIAVGLDPIVRRVAGLVGSRAKALLIVCAGLILVLVAIALLIVPTAVAQVEQLLRDLPTLIIHFESSDLFILIEATYGDEVEVLLNELQAFLTNPANIVAIGGGVLQAGMTVVTGASGLVIVLVLSLYFIATLPTMKQTLTRLAPARARRTVSRMTDEIMESVGHYLNCMVLLALLNAAFVFVLHLVLGLPFPQLMAIAAFCITLIPLVGSLLFWGSASVLALFTSPSAALVFVIVYFLYMQLEAYLFTPRVMNRSVAVPGSLVVIGALVGGTLLGLLGALVAIPVTTSILLIVKQVIIPRQDAKV